LLLVSCIVVTTDALHVPSLSGCRSSLQPLPRRSYGPRSWGRALPRGPAGTLLVGNTGVTSAPTRELGRTGLKVSRIGLGLAAVGRPAYITLGRSTDLGADRTVTAMRTRSHALLDAADAAGVRYVDVARSYGRAEQFLVEWLSTRV